MAMESLQPAMFGRLTPIRTTYSQRGITTTSDVRTTYYRLDDLDRAIVAYPGSLHPLPLYHGLVVGDSNPTNLYYKTHIFHRLTLVK